MLLKSPRRRKGLIQGTEARDLPRLGGGVRERVAADRRGAWCSPWARSSTRGACISLCIVAAMANAATVGATPPGRNGRLAFGVDRGRGAEIFTLKADGSGRRRLTRNQVTDSCVTWSPRGRRIAWCKFTAAGDAEIYVMKANGAGKRPVTDNDSNEFFPSFSPDGTRIVFMSDASGNAEIWTVRLDGTGLRRLTHNPGEDGAPVWSPNGRRIAFTSSRRAGDPSACSIFAGGCNTEIYVMRASGKREKRVTRNRALDAFPDWHPGSRMLLFDSDRSGGGDIYLKRLWRRAPARRITVAQELDFQAEWSPSGRQFVFRSFRDNEDGEVYVKPVKSDRPTRRVTGNSHVETAPSWQPLT